MPRHLQAIILTGMLAGVELGIAHNLFAAAPSPTSYAGVERVITEVRQGWSKPAAAEDPNAPGWNELFDAVLSDLREYSQAANAEARLVPLNRLYQVSAALAYVPWQPAQQLREEMRHWLRPRVRLAWAQRHFDQSIQALPASNDPSITANRERWVNFVENDLGAALTQYNSAGTVSQRLSGLDRVHHALRALQTRNTEHPWQPSWELQNAVNDLFNRPNLDITADVSIVSPIFNQNLVTSGPVYRKGYWSQVTAGPKTGFGLLPSNDGIAFYNSQLLTSVTPITDFQSQIERDPQGQRAAKLYQFSATTTDNSELTIYTVLRTSGLSLFPAYNHSIDALICSNPAAGGGFGRLVAGLIGMNQNRITQRVYEGALPQFQQQIPREALEEAQERIAVEQATRNAELGQYLVGNNMLAVQDFLVSGLSMRSQPSAVYVGGLLQARSGDRQRGADAPQPARLAAPDAGLTADVHLTSVLNSVADGLFQRDMVQSVDNVMIQTKDVPGKPPGDAAKVTKNVDFPTYLKVVDEVTKAKNPKVTAIRIKRPPSAPEFAVDARGFLVALFKDVQMDLPAPDRSSQAGGMIGANARILRAKIPQLEVAFSYQNDQSQPGSNHIKAKVEDFAPVPNSQVLIIEDDEAKAKPLNRFAGALVLSLVGARLKSQPIDLDLASLDLKGMAIQSVAPLDPTGWVRVTLTRPVQYAPAPVAYTTVPAANAPATVTYMTPPGAVVQAQPAVMATTSTAPVTTQPVTSTTAPMTIPTTTISPAGQPVTLQQ